MKEIKIEKGIVLNERYNKYKDVYPFEQMVDGDSFLLEFKSEKERLSGRAMVNKAFAQFKQHTKSDLSYASRIEGVYNLRVWLIFKN
jgi:hypothetical protein